MEPKEERAVCRLAMKVRWGDCDAAGIVYYIKYFDWFSDGRIELFERIGLPYRTTFHERGIELVAIEAGCRYKHSLQPEEKILLETRLTKLTRSRLEFRYQVFRQEDGLLAAEGMTAHAYVDRRGKPFDVKKRHPALWEEINRAVNGSA